MKLIIDAMSGDNAPEALVSGCVMAAKEFGHEYVLVGKEDVIHKLLKQENAENLPIAVRNATEVVDMHDDPARVLRRKKDSSMAVAFQMLADGEGDAMISAGNTGAQLSGATLIVKRIRGIRRAALPTLLPCKTGKVLLRCKRRLYSGISAAICVYGQLLYAAGGRRGKSARRSDQQRHGGHQGRSAAQGSVCDAQAGRRRR